MASDITLSNNPQAPSKMQVKATVIGVIYSIVVNAILPFVIYTALKNYTHVSDLTALFASGVPPMLDTLVGIVRKHRVDLIAGMVLFGIVISIILVLLGGSPRLYLVRESFFTGAFGLAYLVSLLFSRPLSFYFARHFATGNSGGNVEWFNQLWQYPSFRHGMYVMTVVWGVVFLAEMLIRIYLVFTLSIPQFLIVSPFIFYGMFVGVMLWTMRYSRQMRQRGDEARRQSLAESKAQ